MGSVLTSQPSGSEDMGHVFPSQQSVSGPQSTLLPSQPTKCESEEEMGSQSALIPLSQAGVRTWDLYFHLSQA